MTKEVWKKTHIKGYSVSSIGNVRSYKHPAGFGFIDTYRTLKPSIDKYGYPRLCLTDPIKKHYITIHRLVAKTFISNPKNKPQVNHINGVKTDNRVENLEWVTNAENIQHSYDTGLSRGPLGAINGQTNFTEKDIFKIRELSKTNTNVQLAQKYKCNTKTIYNIKSKKTWGHI